MPRTLDPRRHLSAVLVTLALYAAGPTSAQVIIEDFEHGNEGLWVAQTVGFDTLDLVLDAAHDGALGAQLRQTAGDATWRARFDLPSAPGEPYLWYVRSRGTVVAQTQYGRSYLGVGASVNGALFATFAPNSSQILLQSVVGWPTAATITTLASVSAPIQPDTWYVMQIDWSLNGDAALSLFDVATGSLLASIAPTPTSFTTPGGFALRGFTQNTAAFHDLGTLWQLQPAVGSSYCTPAIPNSTGSPAAISAVGSSAVASNDVELISSSLPASSFGFSLTSRAQGSVMNPGGSQGRFCLGGSIGRDVGNIFNSGALGRATLTLDLAQMPTPTGPVAAAVGETWNFQAWYRDANPNVTSNFTGGLQIAFQRTRHRRHAPGPAPGAGVDSQERGHLRRGARHGGSVLDPAWSTGASTKWVAS